MESVLVMIQHSGKWVEANRYEEFEVIGVMIPQDLTYLNLVNLISEELRLNLVYQKIEIKYQVKTEYPPLKIIDDSSFKFYLEIKKKQTDFTMYPLCIIVHDDTPQIHLQQQTTSSISTGSYSACNKNLYSNEIDWDTYLIHSENNPDTLFEKEQYSKLLLKDTIETINNIEKEKETEERVQQTINVPIEDIEFKTGQSFKDKSVLQTCLQFHAIKHHYHQRVLRSCPRSILVKCIDSECDWYLKASTNGEACQFIIRKQNMNHTCAIDTRFSIQRQASSSHIAKSIKMRYLNVKTTYTPIDIKNDMEALKGIKINYMLAWRAKEKALEMIRGNPADSYKLLPAFLYKLLTTNPGSAVDIQVRENNSFLYAFTALKASIIGWQHCKPIIVVDGTFLKAAFGGTLLVATSQDAAGKLFPLAFCVVDSENDLSWEYFITQLREAFGTREGICIVSDRHISIDSAVKKIYPEATHGICMFHLLNNIKTHFKRNAKKIKDPFFAAARAYTESEFDYHMKELDKLDERIKPYLQGIGYKRWSRHHSYTNRFKTMTSNLAESLNAAILHARELPVTTLLMHLHDLQQEYSYTHRNIAMQTRTTLTPVYEKILSYNYTNSLKLQVKPSTNELITVKDNGRKHTVDMKERTCTCNKFEIDEIPCQHALAILNEMHQEPYKYCSKYYTTASMLATYSETVFPIEKEDEWKIPQEVKDMIVFPPQHMTRTGRPKKRRYKSVTEKSKNANCGKCGQAGHNKKTCRNMPKVSHKKKTCRNMPQAA
ncbi:uncharacterized protein LOC126673758 [Mercurialis annua]|uniref:uncharacterized protein LOC126673758 n=1 Tax=Mercurialis annua TaxID=3986 RepID=UPI002160C1CD|nr:uncharacterized protein LOC126673758 [Mercurialis annua]